MQNRVVLAGSCFASPIGNTLDQALANLRAGKSGIRSLESSFPGTGEPYLFTGAIIEPDSQDSDLVEFHPRLSSRYRKALSGFCRQLKGLVAKSGPIADAMVITKRPFYSDWVEASTDTYREDALLETVLAESGLELDPARVYNLQASCSSGLVALNLAVRELMGKPGARMLLLGLGTELHPEAYLVLKKLGALSAQRDPRRSCQPFSLKRSGLVPGEILVALLLESQPREELRVNDILLSAGHGNSDGYRLTDGLESGEYLIEVMARTTRGMALEELDFVCPHATSTPLNDGIERSALEAFFAGRSSPIPVVPLKQYLGHTLNWSGLWETLLTGELIRHNFLPALANVDPLETVEKIEFLSAPRELPLTRALKLSIGFGGINSALIVEKVV